MSNNAMDQVDVRNYLPHRYPFLLVDKVLEIVPEKTIIAIKNVTANEPFFNGHFPDMPVMPGVLMIESLAQASGLLIYATMGRKPTENEDFFLAGVDNARFKRLVVPGDQLQLNVEIIKKRLDVWKFRGEATVDGELACSAEFMNIRNERSES